MQTHGRFKDFIFYMNIEKDYESLIAHYINDEDVIFKLSTEMQLKN